MLALAGPNGDIPAIGVPSASALPHGHMPAAAYNLFSIEKDNSGWRCDQTVHSLEKDLTFRTVKSTRLI